MGGTISGDAVGLDADTSGEGGGVPAPEYPREENPPTVTITAPAEGTEVGASAVVKGVAADDTGVAALTVQVGWNVALPAGVPDADGAFVIPVTLGYGTQQIVVRAYDVAGNEGAATVGVARPAPAGDTVAPELLIHTPQEGFAVATPFVAVAGSASDDGGVSAVSVQVEDGEPLLAQTSDHYASWYFKVGLLPGAVNTIRVVATDHAGNTTMALVAGSTTAVGDLEPPTITITDPPNGHATAADEVVVSGTASDASGLSSVGVRVGNGPYQEVDTADDYASWTATVSILPGPNTIKARAIDAFGLTASDEIQVANNSGDEWGPPITLTLGWAPPDYASSQLEVDKAGLSALLSDASADQLVMLELDVRPLMQDALDTIREACGSGWREGDVSYNCPWYWGQPEINMFNLVTMTPANINVEGTSIQGMKELAGLLSSLGLIDDFSKVLADALDIGVLDTIISNESVSDALVDGVIGSHPNALAGGFMPVTMLDALEDMTTLAAKFDAAGWHPGFLDSVTGSTYSQVLSDSFEMMMVAISNLHWHDGVALSEAQKAYIALIADQTGPTYNDVVEFDFISPATFQVSGISPSPKVDLVFTIDEYDSWVAVGTSRFPTPTGDSLAWDLDPWLLERVVVDGAFRHYQYHRIGCDYCSGSGTGALLYEALLGIDETEIVIGRDGYDKDGDGWAEHFDWIDPNPAGWMRIWTLFGLGDPPAPQYVWDMILEVAERRLLDGGVVQGEGDVRFELTGIDVGLTGEQIKEATRPVLESQKSKLSELLVGDYQSSANALDFYLVRGDDQKLYLFFVDPSDPVPGGTASHSVRGFFGDEQLTQKVSTTADGGSGDSTHEKLALTGAEQSVYCRDATGALHRVKVGPATGEGATVVVRRHVGGGTP